MYIYKVATGMYIKAIELAHCIIQHTKLTHNLACHKRWHLYILICKAAVDHTYKVRSIQA